MDTAIYQRARAAGYPARSAVIVARQTERPAMPDYGQPADWGERDGFTIRVSLDYDEGMTLRDMGYGTFLDGSENWRTGYSMRPDPDAVPNPYRDSRNPSNGSAWYLPGDAGTLKERADYYHGATYGASRSVAFDLARESVMDELRRATDDYGPAIYVVTVTASKAGVDLGSASMGGFEGGWDPITRAHNAGIEDYINDLVSEAINEARATLAELAEEVASV